MPGVMKGPFLTDGAVKDSFLTLCVVKGPFLTGGAVKGTFLTSHAAKDPFHTVRGEEPFSPPSAMKDSFLTPNVAKGPFLTRESSPSRRRLGLFPFWDSVTEEGKRQRARQARTIGRRHRTPLPGWRPTKGTRCDGDKAHPDTNRAQALARRATAASGPRTPA